VPALFYDAGMAFLSSPVTVRVPATSANLGPGFDSLGLALSWYDTVTARVTGSGVRVSVTGEGAGELPADERHLVAATMLATFDRLGGRPDGIELSCANSIPQARGLGSSSAAIVAGILLARELVESGPARLDQAGMVRLASEIEGHPDNVAPCVMGGFTVAWTTGPGGAGHGVGDPGGARAVSIGYAAGITPVVFVPGQRGYTSHARAVLPAAVPFADAAFNAARTALFVHAVRADPGRLIDATEDRLHQSYRAPAMPETAELVATLRGKGLAAVVSGSGPGVLALVVDEPRDAHESGDGGRVDQARDLCPDGWSARVLTVSAEGAHVR
jgi:homoserine kinase